MQSTNSRTAIFITAVGCFLLTLIYWPALRTFFSNDDWVLVYHYGRMPLSQPWEFFSPHVIWFYRPLQALQFSIFSHFFGLNEVPYNISLVVAHFVLCALVFCLIRSLSGRDSIAASGTLVFAVQWIYVDILLWKANFNTVQWALFAVACCAAYSYYLLTRRKIWFWAAIALCILNFFTKESSANTPLLLLLVWLFHEARSEEFRPQNWVALGLRAFRSLWPFGTLTLIYFVLHRLLVRDIYGGIQPDYGFVAPWQALRQVMFIYNHAVLSFYPDPVLLPQFPLLRKAVLWCINYLLILPIVLALLGWRGRNRLLLFGTAWLLVAFIPCVFLKSFHASRFYYVPAIGSAIIWVELIRHAWTWLSTRPGSAPRMARLAVVTFVVYGVVVNASVTRLQVDTDEAQSNRARVVYQLLCSYRGRLESGALIVLENAPTTFFNNGLGATEMARIALADPKADGVINGQGMDTARLTKVRAIPNVYSVDLAQTPLTLKRIAGGPQSASPASMSQR